MHIYICVCNPSCAIHQYIYISYSSCIIFTDIYNTNVIYSCFFYQHPAFVVFFPRTFGSLRKHNDLPLDSMGPSVPNDSVGPTAMTQTTVPCFDGSKQIRAMNTKNLGCLACMYRDLFKRKWIIFQPLIFRGSIKRNGFLACIGGYTPLCYKAYYMPL